MKKKSNNRGKRFVKRLKRGVVICGLLLVSSSIFLNSSFVAQYQDNVYSNLREKYGLNKTMEETQNAEIATDSQEEKTINKEKNEIVKNYTLTVDMDLRTKSNVSAEEIDKKLKEQSMRAKYARGDI